MVHRATFLPFSVESLFHLCCQFLYSASLFVGSHRQLAYRIDTICRLLGITSPVIQVFHMILMYWGAQSMKISFFPRRSTMSFSHVCIPWKVPKASPSQPNARDGRSLTLRQAETTRFFQVSSHKRTSVAVQRNCTCTDAVFGYLFPHVEPPMLRRQPVSVLGTENDDIDVAFDAPMTEFCCTSVGQQCAKPWESASR